MASHAASWEWKTRAGPSNFKIDIPNRRIDLVIDDAALAARRKKMEARGPDAWKPNRDRTVSLALQAYAALTTSASRGAVRDVSQIVRPAKPKA